MKEQLVNFKVSKLAKKKGFDWLVRDSYAQYVEAEVSLTNTTSLYDCNHNKNVKQYSAPTQSLLQKFLREVHFIDVNFKLNTSLYCKLYEKNRGKKALNYHWVVTPGIDREDKLFEEFYSKKTYLTPEEALDDALLKGLKFVQ
jgi:hypothetical protein